MTEQEQAKVQAAPHEMVTDDAPKEKDTGRQPWRVGSWLDHFASGLTAWLSAGICLVLAVASLFVTVRFDSTTYLERTYPMARMPLLGLILCLALVAVYLLVTHPLAKDTPGTRRAARIITVVAVMWVTTAAAVWAVSLRSIPRADQEYLWWIAQNIAHGETGRLIEQYAQAYPQQLGTGLVFTAFVKILGEYPMPRVGLVNALCAGSVTLTLCAFTKEFGGRARAVALCALLCMGFAPLTLYSAFVYGTLCALACALWALFAAVRLAHGGSRWWWLVVAVLLPLGTLLYNNTLIFAVAAFCILLTAGLQKGWRGALSMALPALVVLVVSMGAPRAAEWWVCRTMDIPFWSGAPKILWINMGIHSWEGVAGPGSNDTTNWNIFFDHGGDTAAAQAFGMEKFRQYVAVYLAEPESLVFFAKKSAYQWLDPWFGAMTMCVDPSTGTAGRISKFLYEGPIFSPVQEFLTVLLGVLYGCAVLGALWLRKTTRRALWGQATTLAFLGGFLFQLVWESKSRYCFPYAVMLIPAAAVGLCCLADGASRTKASLLARREKKEGRNAENEG